MGMGRKDSRIGKQPVQVPEVEREGTHKKVRCDRNSEAKEKSSQDECRDVEICCTDPDYFPNK